MVVSLRQRSGLENPEPIKKDEELMTKLEEAIIHPEKHPHLHALAEDIRHTFGITGETPEERLKSIFGGLHKLVSYEVKKKKEEWGAVPTPPVTPTPPVVRPVTVPEVKAECVKTLVSSGEAFDIGDIEGIKIGEDIVITLPSGKEIYLITKGRGVIPTTAKKLGQII